MLVDKLKAALWLPVMWILLGQFFIPASAQDNEHFFSIPVFWITDRNREPCHDKNDYIKFGRSRQYVGHTCNHDPHIGYAEVIITNTRDKKLSENLSKIGWKKADKHGEGTIAVMPIEGCTYEEAKDKFYDQLHKAAQETNDHEVFVFAPGYMSTFEIGLQEAARFAYYAERPVLLYSWPSKGKFRDYSSDEASIEWSQEHYNEMLHELSDIGKREQGVSFRLFAHSMGSRLLLRGIPIVKGDDTFKEVSFVCPDVDDGVVKHYITKCLFGAGNTTVRLYMSRKDEMLKLSQFVHGGYARLGEKTGSLISDSPSPYKEESSCASSIPEEVVKRFQTIDFTSMDEGTLGHKIPVALICSISQTGKPEKGINFKHQKEGGCPIMQGVSCLGKQKPGYFEVSVDGLHVPVLTGLHRKLPLPHTLLKKDWTLK